MRCGSICALRWATSPMPVSWWHWRSAIRMRFRSAMDLVPANRHLTSVFRVRIAHHAVFSPGFGFRRLGLATLAGAESAHSGAHRRRVLGFLAAAAYTALSGFGIPAQRTLLMLAGAAVVALLDRTPTPSRLLAVALAVVVLLDPWAAHAPGFWLSFGAVAALCSRRRALASGCRSGWLEQDAMGGHAGADAVVAESVPGGFAGFAAGQSGGDSADQSIGSAVVVAGGVDADGHSRRRLRMPWWPR
jgi:hypothetical protein